MLRSQLLAGRVTSSTLVLTLLLLALGPAPVGAAAKTPWNKNLLKNPGAERGFASTDGYQVVVIPGWRTSGNATVVKYGTPDGFPTKKEGKRIKGKKQFFTSGLAQTTAPVCGSLYQDVDVSSRAAMIAKGRVKAIVTARVATFETQSDTALVNLRFDPFQATVRGSVTGTKGKFKKIKLTGMLNPGVRTLTVQLATATHQGGYCDGYFDKVKLIVKKVK